MERRNLPPEERRLLILRESLIADYQSSGLRQYIPSDVRVVLVPDDNEQLAELNRRLGEEALASGKKVITVYSSRERSNGPYINFSVTRSNEKFESDRSRILNNFSRSELMQASMANDALWIVVPDDDLELAKYITDDADKARLPNQDILKVIASRDESGDYTRFTILPTTSSEDKSP